MPIKRGFAENYETVGKKVTEKGFLKFLDKKEKMDVQCNAQNSVIRFNSEYMDVLGTWYFFKTAGVLGFLTIIFVSLWMLSIAIIYMRPGGDVVWFYIAVTSMIGLGFFTIFMIHQIRRDFFHYTYYPIRFNRIERKVYVMNPNKTVSVYDWDDLTVTLNNPWNSYVYIRLSILDDDDKVKETFSLPYLSDYGVKDGLIGHWEFFRSYMEEGPEKSYHCIREYYNIHGRKEKMFEIFYATIMVDRNVDDDLEDNSGDTSSIKLALIFFPIFFSTFLARYIHEKFNKLPPMSGSFLVDEQKYKDDPYQIENKLKNFKKEIQIDPKEKMLLWTWGPLSLILIYLFFELMAYWMKGETLLLGYLF